MHLKMLEDQSRDNYNQQIRDMSKAAASTNMQQLGEKQSRENYMRRYEADRDQTDLSKVNSTCLNPSATQTMGTSANFRM